MPGGRIDCKSEDGKLIRRSLGYMFQTSVLRIRFEEPALQATCKEDWDYAYSVLQGLIMGIFQRYGLMLSEIENSLIKSQTVTMLKPESGYLLVLLSISI